MVPIPQLSDDRASELFHGYERILDKHYQSLPLWHRDRAEATFAALAQFDVDMMVKPEVMPALGTSELTTAKHLKGRQEGLSQAIEWLTEHGQQVSISSAMNRELYVEAYRFLARDILHRMSTQESRPPDQRPKRRLAYSCASPLHVATSWPSAASALISNPPPTNIEAANSNNMT